MLGDATATGTILDDDQGVTLSKMALEVAEAGGTA